MFLMWIKENKQLSQKNTVQVYITINSAQVSIKKKNLKTQFARFFFV
jgi:hypothetical protein